MKFVLVLPISHSFAIGSIPDQSRKSSLDVKFSILIFQVLKTLLEGEPLAFFAEGSQFLLIVIRYCRKSVLDVVIFSGDLGSVAGEGWGELIIHVENG